MKPSLIATVAVFGVAALTGCTGGNMGDTRGGGAAPGQSGGRDTAHSAAPAPASTPAAATSGAAVPTPSTDTTKQRGKVKQP